MTCVVFRFICVDTDADVDNPSACVFAHAQVETRYSPSRLVSLFFSTTAGRTNKQAAQWYFGVRSRARGQSERPRKTKSSSCRQPYAKQTKKLK